MIKEADGKFYKVGDDGQPLTDKNGDIIYYTKDNKYTYSDADSQVLGHNAPKWTMGFQNSFTYKNFDLTIYAYFRWGQMINYEMLGCMIQQVRVISLLILTIGRNLILQMISRHQCLS